MGSNRRREPVYPAPGGRVIPKPEWSSRGLARHKLAAQWRIGFLAAWGIQQREIDRLQERVASLRTTADAGRRLAELEDETSRLRSLLLSGEQVEHPDTEPIPTQRDRKAG